MVILPHNDVPQKALQMQKRYHVHVPRIPKNINIWHSIQTQENIMRNPRDQDKINKYNNKNKPDIQSSTRELGHGMHVTYMYAWCMCSN